MRCFFVTDQLHDEQADNVFNDDQSTDTDKRKVIAKAASSFGDLSYAVDVNPIVMTKAPDPLEQFSGDLLKAQDKYYEEQEKKHRETLQALQLHNNIDTSRQKKRQAVRQNVKANSAKGSLLQAIMSGKDANKFVKDVNFASDKKREHERIKQQTRTDIEQQVTGVDINPRQQSLDSQTDSALDQILGDGSLNGRTIASVSNGDGTSSTQSTTTNSVKSEDTGETEKTIRGQDDNLLGLTDNQSANDNSLSDPVDLLNSIQADFEVISAEQTVIKNSQPMINLNIRLGEIPSTIRDKNGFVVDLSKKDIAKLKTALKKRLSSVMKKPVPIKTFNHLVAGNGQQSYNETELSTAILKGNHIDFSKSISENRPLKFKSVINLTKDNVLTEPDMNVVKTPVDLRLDENRRNQVERLNQADLKAYEEDLKLKRENHSKKDLKLKQSSKSSPDLEM